VATDVHICGRTGAREVRFRTPLLLAPMEGVTDACFRSVVLDLGGVGGASTEFVRVSASVIPMHVIRRHLGPPRADVPVAVQIMASGRDHLAETISNAESAGAAWVDLNFGCPVARVCGKGAGSALLGDPPRIQEIVAEAVDATELPVSAKIRVGLEDADRLDEIVDAVSAGGAAMLTVHGRRRVDGLQSPANWAWIAAAAARWRTRGHGPVCGNGDVGSAEDARRMMRETGCDLVLVGRGAIANPFVFRDFAGGPPVTADEAARFAMRYEDSVHPVVSSPYRLGRIKQLVRYYRAGGLFEGREDDRERLLRTKDMASIRAWFEEFLTGARPAGNVLTNLPDLR